MTGRRDELEDFKTAIDLRSFAAHAFGFQIDPKATSANSALMVGPSSEKIVIARSSTDLHYVYFSVHDTRDCGSIVDFCQNRGVGSLGQIRLKLRPYLGRDVELPPAVRFDKPLSPIDRDIAGVRARWQEMELLRGGQHRYLNEVRCLQPELLRHPRFAPHIRTDDRGNAVFVHLDHAGVCGFELRNDGFTGFSKGGAKGLWASRAFDGDRNLCLAESAIDALSYADTHDIETTRFISLAGQVSPVQVELVRAAIQKLPADAGERSHVILAFDNDAAGRAFVERFSEVFRAVGRDDLALLEDQPPSDGQDWNDVVRLKYAPTPHRSLGPVLADL